MKQYKDAMWRTLLRVEKIEENAVHFIIPAWNYEQPVVVEKNKIPNEILLLLKPDFRLHAKVNIGNDDVSELIFEEWQAFPNQLF